MNIVYFAKAVRKMRAAQKAYFKTRLQADLVASKQWEAIVDKALADGVILRVEEPTPLHPYPPALSPSGRAPDGERELGEREPGEGER